jgi:uncharacterized membrane protein YhaH (DUF805 family)
MKSLDFAPTSLEEWKKLLFSFQGRTDRRAYWLIFVILSVLWLGVEFILRMWIDSAGGINQVIEQINPWLARAILLTWLILNIWIALAIQIKRLHDLNKSGAFVAINLVPYIGNAVMMIWLGFFPGTPSDNEFGPSLSKSL